MQAVEPELSKEERRTTSQEQVSIIAREGRAGRGGSLKNAEFPNLFGASSLLQTARNRRTRRPRHSLA